MGEVGGLCEAAKTRRTTRATHARNAAQRRATPRNAAGWQGMPGTLVKAAGTHRRVLERHRLGEEGSPNGRLLELEKLVTHETDNQTRFTDLAAEGVAEGEWGQGVRKTTTMRGKVTGADDPSPLHDPPPLPACVARTYRSVAQQHQLEVAYPVGRHGTGQMSCVL